MTDLSDTTATAPGAGTDFQERLMHLRRRFVERTRQDGATIRRLRAEGLHGVPLAGDLLRDLQRTVHGLSGAAGVFGFDSISDAAHRVERRLRAFGGVEDDADHLLDALETELEDLWAREGTA